MLPLLKTQHNKKQTNKQTKTKKDTADSEKNHISGLSNWLEAGNCAEILFRECISLLSLCLLPLRPKQNYCLLV